MIDADYVQILARYNAWQNTQLEQALTTLDAPALTLDRGAFFGSIMGTINHLLWGDHIWMSRLDGGSAPPGGIKESVSLCATLEDWRTERPRIDERIGVWAEALRSDDLQGDLTWRSAAAGRDVTLPVATCVVHMFNHQTHHRGQVHAMLTAAGTVGPVSDLVFMPEEA